MIGIKILGALNACFYVYSLMIIARCLLSFLPINYSNDFVKGFIWSVDIYLNLFKKIIPPLGMFDFSPIIAIFALGIIKFIILNILAFVLNIIGLL